MANNFIDVGQQLPAGVFDPQPDPATLARNLVAVGIFVASSAILSALQHLLHPVVALGIHMQYTFAIALALALIFLFGLGMILIGWLVSNAPERHAALGRITMRASHVVLVFAVALRKFAPTK